MSLKDELATITRSALEEKALTFAINIQSELKKVATEGACELFISINQENKKWAQSTEFLKMVGDLLEGINIEVVEERSALFPSYSIFNSKFIRLSW